MAVKLDNLDDFLDNLEKLGKAADTEVIREARKNMRATVRRYIPIFKAATPRQSGNMAKSVKVKSQSRRGLSTVQMVWDMKGKPAEVSFEAFGVKVVKKTEKFINYSGFVNFKKDNKKSRLFASDKFQEVKAQMDKAGSKDVVDAFKLVFKNRGVRIK